MRRIFPFFAVLILALIGAGGCSRHSRATLGAGSGSKEDPIERDLAENGVIWSGWSVSENDGDIDKWPARLYADANRRVEEKIMRLFPPERDYLLATTQVRFVPDWGGYEILVLSGKRLTDAQQEIIRKAASEAMDEAHASWRSKLRDIR